MALGQELKLKGVNLPEAYIRLDRVILAVDIYADVDARKAGTPIDHQTIFLPASKEVYEVLRQASFADAKEIGNGWKDVPAVEEIQEPETEKEIEK